MQNINSTPTDIRENQKKPLSRINQAAVDVTGCNLDHAYCFQNSEVVTVRDETSTETATSEEDEHVTTLSVNAGKRSLVDTKSSKERNMIEIVMLEENEKPPSMSYPQGERPAVATKSDGNMSTKNSDIGEPLQSENTHSERDKKVIQIDDQTIIDLDDETINGVTAETIKQICVDKSIIDLDNQLTEVATDTNRKVDMVNEDTLSAHSEGEDAIKIDIDEQELTNNIIKTYKTPKRSVLNTTNNLTPNNTPKFKVANINNLVSNGSTERPIDNLASGSNSSLVHFEEDDSPIIEDVDSMEAHIPNTLTNDNVASFHPIFINGVAQDEDYTILRYKCYIQRIEIKRICVICNLKTKNTKYKCVKGCVIKYVCGDECFEKFRYNEPTLKLYEPFAKFLATSLVDDNFKHTHDCNQCARLILDSDKVCSWEAMDFCKESCLYRFQKKLSSACAECGKIVSYVQQGKYCVRLGNIIRQFCSGSCLEAKKKHMRICSYCQKGMRYVRVRLGNKVFCNDICKGVFENLQKPNRPPFLINPDDARCFVCKINTTMRVEFEYHNSSYYFCTRNCFIVFKFIQNCDPRKCNSCAKYVLQQYLECNALHYDKQILFFCSTNCKKMYIISHRKVVACVWCKVKKYNFDMIQTEHFYSTTLHACSLNCLNQLTASVDYISNKQKMCTQCRKAGGFYEIKLPDGTTKEFCSNNCISHYQSIYFPQNTRRKNRLLPTRIQQLPIISSVVSLAPVIKKIIVVEDTPQKKPEIRNVSSMVAPLQSESVCQANSTVVDAEVQVDVQQTRYRVIMVPIYIPMPISMWRAPVPVPVPFPLLLPCPFIIPLTKRLAGRLLKEIKPPTPLPEDPFEAELLMMAAFVATDKEEEKADGHKSTVSSNNTVAITDAIKLTTDFEGVLTACTVKPYQAGDSSDEPLSIYSANARGRGRGRGRSRGRGRRPNASPRGRGRKRAIILEDSSSESLDTFDLPPLMTTTSRRRKRTKSDCPPTLQPFNNSTSSNLTLNHTYGVDSWNKWISSKVSKTNLLQMTSDEINNFLCTYINEIRKPSGCEYAPDTIYYLCLGIQEYLYENHRVDNIFFDPFYEKFTDSFDQVACRFPSSSDMIITRIVAEHLWETNQLGSHSPRVLLNTLIYFNTMYYNMFTIEAHMGLALENIVKQTGRNKEVVCRYFPPKNMESDGKRTLEQLADRENPMRCPVHLYDFYLSKCPESVKTKRDLFYLQPENSCAPDSPIWFSTNAIDRDALAKMFNRVKMVKEINIQMLLNK